MQSQTPPSFSTKDADAFSSMLNAIMVKLDAITVKLDSISEKNANGLQLSDDDLSSNNTNQTNTLLSFADQSSNSSNESTPRHIDIDSASKNSSDSDSEEATPKFGRSKTEPPPNRASGRKVTFAPNQDPPNSPTRLNDNVLSQSGNRQPTPKPKPRIDCQQLRAAARKSPMVRRFTPWHLLVPPALRVEITQDQTKLTDGIHNNSSSTSTLLPSPPNQSLEKTSPARQDLPRSFTLTSTSPQSAAQIDWEKIHQERTEYPPTYVGDKGKNFQEEQYQSPSKTTDYNDALNHRFPQRSPSSQHINTVDGPYPDNNSRTYSLSAKQDPGKYASAPSLPKNAVGISQATTSPQPYRSGQRASASTPPAAFDSRKIYSYGSGHSHTKSTAQQNRNSLKQLSPAKLGTTASQNKRTAPSSNYTNGTTTSTFYKAQTVSVKNNVDDSSSGTAGSGEITTNMSPSITLDRNNTDAVTTLQIPKTSTPAIALLAQPEPITTTPAKPQYTLISKKTVSETNSSQQATGFQLETFNSNDATKIVKHLNTETSQNITSSKSDPTHNAANNNNTAAPLQINAEFQEFLQTLLTPLKKHNAHIPGENNSASSNNALCLWRPSTLDHAANTDATKSFTDVTDQRNKKEQKKAVAVAQTIANFQQQPPPPVSSTIIANNAASNGNPGTAVVAKQYPQIFSPETLKQAQMRACMQSFYSNPRLNPYSSLTIQHIDVPAIANKNNTTTSAKTNNISSSSSDAVATQPSAQKQPPVIDAASPNALTTAISVSEPKTSSSITNTNNTYSTTASPKPNSLPTAPITNTATNATMPQNTSTTTRNSNKNSNDTSTPSTSDLVTTKTETRNQPTPPKKQYSWVDFAAFRFSFGPQTEELITKSTTEMSTTPLNTISFGFAFFFSDHHKQTTESNTNHTTQKYGT
jgi:hypothetical protein